MSAKFNGFTPDDISKFANKSKNKENAAKTTSRPNGIRRLPDIKTSQTTPQTDIYNDSNSSVISDLNPLQEAVHFKPLPKKVYPPEDESILQLGNGNGIQDESDEKNSEKIEPSPFKGMSLKDFESRRKVVEEQNKMNKELLYKAIEQHSEKTAAEVKKIQDIKKELTKLDSELASDVALLRKQIELASVSYMETQKNYIQIEKQFLKAKLDLHHSNEKKELLTEHLCTIISHNEDRKAKKLTELMEKVGISPVHE